MQTYSNHDYASAIVFSYGKAGILLYRRFDGYDYKYSAQYTSYLSQRNVLYDLRYASESHLPDSRYVVLDPRGKNDFEKYTHPNYAHPVNGESCHNAGHGGNRSDQENFDPTDGAEYENLIWFLEHNGYSLFDKQVDGIEVYRKTENQ